MPDPTRWFEGHRHRCIRRRCRDRGDHRAATVDEFLALMAIRAKDLAQPTPQSPSMIQWRDVESILTQCIKRRRFPSWRTEESSAGVRLGPEEFWTAIAEPVESDWPPLQAPGVPLIDPDSQTVKALPEYVAGVQAREAWTQRRDDLVAIAAALKSTRESGGASGFESMLRLAIGFPNPGDPLQHDPDALRSDLLSNDATRVASATDAVTKDFCLSVDAFGRLMTVRDQDRQPDPAKKPLAAHYAAIYALLTTARKVKHEYPQWTADEVARVEAEAAPLGEPVAYWKARKAALPHWRASSDARQRWTQALLAREQPPAIDPDLLTEDDLRDPFPSRPPFPLHPAFDLLQVRRKWVDDIEQAIVGAARTSRPSRRTSRRASRLPICSRWMPRQAGIDIQHDSISWTWIGASGLSSRRSAIARAEPAAADPRRRVAKAVDHDAGEKVRFFAAWRAEEAAAAITVSPDSFVLVSSAAFSDPSALDPWRAPWKSRVAWQDTLRSRIDQENDVAAEIRDANGAVEGALLPALRDALVDAAGPVGATRDDRATWLEKRLLVAMDDDGCAETTRIEQALETLQDWPLTDHRSFQNGLEFSDLRPPGRTRPGRPLRHRRRRRAMASLERRNGLASVGVARRRSSVRAGCRVARRGTARCLRLRAGQPAGLENICRRRVDGLGAAGWIHHGIAVGRIGQCRAHRHLRARQRWRAVFIRHTGQHGARVGARARRAAPGLFLFGARRDVAGCGHADLHLCVRVGRRQRALQAGPRQRRHAGMGSFAAGHPQCASDGGRAVAGSPRHLRPRGRQRHLSIRLPGSIPARLAGRSRWPCRFGPCSRIHGARRDQRLRARRKRRALSEALHAIRVGTVGTARSFRADLGRCRTIRRRVEMDGFVCDLAVGDARISLSRESLRAVIAFSLYAGFRRFPRQHPRVAEYDRKPGLRDRTANAAAYEDIAKIEIAASCEAQANVVAGTPCAPITMPKPLVFLFGRGESPGAPLVHVRFSRQSDFAQSF